MILHHAFAIVALDVREGESTAQTKNATNVKVSKETEGGKTVYEVESKVNGLGRDLMVSPDCELLSIEEETTLRSIPPAAKAAIEKMASGGKIG